MRFIFSSLLNTACSLLIFSVLSSHSFHFSFSFQLYLFITSIKQKLSFSSSSFCVAGMSEEKLAFMVNSVSKWTEQSGKSKYASAIVQAHLMQSVWKALFHIILTHICVSKYKYMHKSIYKLSKQTEEKNTMVYTKLDIRAHTHIHVIRFNHFKASRYNWQKPAEKIRTSYCENKRNEMWWI